MATTIKDVAKQAGVSVATASRVLSGAQRVSPELADRVRKAAQDLGYRHNALARALRHGRTATVGMIVPEIENPFFPSLVESVERALNQTGRSLLLCDAQRDPNTERQRATTLLERQVDGLIVIPVSMKKSAATLAETALRIPVVQVDCYAEGVSLDWVGIDNELGISLAVEHVVSLGAKRITLVSAIPDSSTAKHRLSGFESALARTGVSCCPPPLLGAFSADWGKQAAKRLLEERRLPDAIICGNDEIAVGLLGEFHRVDVSVPDEVMVTGFDDIRFAALSNPPLTTVRQPHETIANQALSLLDARIEDRHIPAQRVAVAPRLVIRESTRVKHD
ncbi:LacI family transcriptional regulator [Coriobacteriia bacterium Es71-Z0120]|uniref:LacI family DNA-binding transcriptional regulator n=1 Tax=Parvivirga hydrogeniphila TaxID=2939460 RepID=UPI002260E03B|nr:LacI family transcriptional regulator [Parvivirga hydrogeniphila]